MSGPHEHVDSRSTPPGPFMAPVPRDATVADLRYALADLPDYYSVAPVVNGTVGVFQGVMVKTTNDGPLVIVGEIHTGNVATGVLER